MNTPNVVRDGWREGMAEGTVGDRRCVLCSRPVDRGKARYCSRACQQRAYRLRQPAVAGPELDEVRRALQQRRALVAQTVYECPVCGERLLGERRCEECRRFCRALGLGGRCPDCDTLILLSELLAGAALP